MESDVVASTDTIVLLGGSSAIGKTVSAAAIARRLGLQHARLDDLWIMSRSLLTPAERPTLHAFADIHTVLLDPIQELQSKLRDIAATLSPAIEVMIAMHLSRSQGAVLDGVWIEPTLAAQSKFDGVEARGRVRSVFVHESDEHAIVETMHSRGDFMKYTEPEQRCLAELSLVYGQAIRREAEELRLPVVQARPRETLVDRILVAARLDSQTP
jgi:2-phosphoglycerate kinase